MKNGWFLITIWVFWGCSRSGSPSNIDFTKLPYKTLSEYSLFTGDLKNFTEAEGVIPYEPVSSLFTDYAFKKRYVWMPENTHASLPDDPDASLDFPDKTILVKHFYYPLDFRKPDGEKRIIETRLLVKNKGSWEAYPYLWNAEQTEATLKNTGAAVPVEYTNEKGEKVAFNYVMPQKTQCRSCHNKDGVMLPIGPKGKQLAGQLEKWQAAGRLKTGKDLSAVHSLVNPMDASRPLADRARAYLDVNCGHCHSRQGPASTSGLYYNAEEDRPFHLGVWKSPVAAGMGGGGFKFDIYPGHSKESIVTHRMNSTHPGVMMPEIGRVTIHKEGVELIAEWIGSLPDTPAGKPD